VLEAYKPEFILVSAGFDAHDSDPLGGMRLTEDGYEQLTQILMHLAWQLCSGRLVLTLEGGYNLKALRNSAEHILMCLSHYDPEHESVPAEPSFDALSSSFKSRLKEVLSTQYTYWPMVPQF
jgi:acetoin utilization deacetylase AcuC-like enzyme